MLARAVKSLVYLHVGLACVLIFIGAKMAADRFVHLPTLDSLLIVGSLLGAAIIASLVKSKSVSLSV